MYCFFSFWYSWFGLVRAHLIGFNFLTPNRKSSGIPDLTANAVVNTKREGLRDVFQARHITITCYDVLILQVTLVRLHFFLSKTIIHFKHK